jgi:hypothetical protein
MHDALDVAGQFQNVTLVFHGVELIKTDRKGAACIGRIGCRYLLTKAGKQPFPGKVQNTCATCATVHYAKGACAAFAINHEAPAATEYAPVISFQQFAER